MIYGIECFFLNLLKTPTANSLLSVQPVIFFSVNSIDATDVDFFTP